mgnify:CR=1 FL=1
MEKGTLGIMRRGSTYQVHYASNNPYSTDYQPCACPTATHLETLLSQIGADAWSIQQAFAELRKGRFVALSIVASPAHLAACFEHSMTATQPAWRLDRELRVEQAPAA